MSHQRAGDPTQLLVDLEEQVVGVVAGGARFAGQSVYPPSRSARRRTLPTIVFGSSARNSIRDGTLYGASFSRQKARRSDSETAWPDRSTTHALTASPFTSSATPATPTSAIDGCDANTSSISRGHTW